MTLTTTMIDACFFMGSDAISGVDMHLHEQAWCMEWDMVWHFVSGS